ncbi:hypothetical protein CYMTET_26967 [Cymbomonas tetramitiformis]|uniref:Uncharacterized protein n=1 Tax=Cymbomonas tetramitiformis TaxID=36881 RepID=A0AAE0FQQ5_9CHLO|nr:hypothetical protein CYMTET_26967 [Cymbomonas tetramitiformis]
MESITGLALWAAILVGFYGLFRKDNLTVGKSQAWNARGGAGPSPGAQPSAMYRARADLGDVQRCPLGNVQVRALCAMMCRTLGDVQRA